MKPLNNRERKMARIKFIGMYGISIALIIIVFSGFLQPSPSTKTVMIKKEKPARVMIKKIYVMQKSAAENYTAESDSLKAIIILNQKKIDELSADTSAQKNIIAQLQNQNSATNKPADNSPDKNELAKLKKQIKFYDWALRSQVAVTNTLTKENNALKNKIQQAGKQ